MSDKEIRDRLISWAGSANADAHTMNSIIQDMGAVQIDQLSASATQSQIKDKMEELIEWAGKASRNRLQELNDKFTDWT